MDRPQDKCHLQWGFYLEMIQIIWLVLSLQFQYGRTAKIGKTGLVEVDKREPGYAEMATAGVNERWKAPLENFTSRWGLWSWDLGIKPTQRGKTLQPRVMEARVSEAEMGAHTGWLRASKLARRPETPQTQVRDLGHQWAEACASWWKSGSNKIGNL